MDAKYLQMIDAGRCIALIPARGGSKSVPKKNIREVHGFPLIAYSIAAAKLSHEIERVIVSTDSEEIAGIARAYGAETPFLRPAEYAQDHSPDIEFVKHAIEWLAENEKKIPEYLVHIRVTSPMRDVRIMDEAIERIRKDRSATSLRSGHICIHPPYKWFRFDETEYVKPLMPGMTCDEANLPRQGFPKVLIPNGYVDVLKSEFIIKTDLMHGERMIGFVTDEVPDVDNMLDLKKLEVYEGMTEALDRLLQYMQECRRLGKQK